MSLTIQYISLHSKEQLTGVPRNKINTCMISLVNHAPKQLKQPNLYIGHLRKLSGGKEQLIGAPRNKLNTCMIIDPHYALCNL